MKKQGAGCRPPVILSQVLRFCGFWYVSFWIVSVRFIDDTHAQILTRMNDRHTYHDDGEVYAGWGLYVDDVMKCSDGAWRMTCVRLAYGVMENQLRTMKQQQDG